MKPIKVNNPVPGLNSLLYVTYKKVNPSPVTNARCRFDLFIKLHAGVLSWLPHLKRTWCYRGDRYADSEQKMLCNLLNLVTKRIDACEIIIIYDNHNTGEERTLLKISKGIIEANRLNVYSLMLIKYDLPKWLQ